MALEDTTTTPEANTETATNIVPVPTRPEPAKPSDKALAFVKEHPFITVAGGIAAGLLVSALIPKRANRGLTKRALRLAETGAAAALSFSQSTLGKAEDGGIYAQKKAKVLAHQAEKFASVAAKKAGTIGENAASKAERLSSIALEKAGAWGQAASERADKIGILAASKAEQLGSKASERLSDLSETALARSQKALAVVERQSIPNRLMAKLRELLARVRG